MSVSLDDIKIENSKVQFVVNELKSILNGGITKATVMTATLHGMLALRKFTDMQGGEKKKVLLAALQALVEQSDMTAEDKFAADTILELSVPEAIDSIAAAASGQIKLKIPSSWCCCFSAAPESK